MLKEKQVVGKNAPPKLPQNRPRAIPSIPSNTVAPPEDKTVTMTTMHNIAAATDMATSTKNNGFRTSG